MASYTFPLESLPSEIKVHIFSYLSQKRLYELVLTGRALSHAANINLYSFPKFVSTYRFAQFVTTVSHSRHHADMVRTFCLWDKDEDANRSDDLASWMEWKYRTVSLYAARPAPKPVSVRLPRLAPTCVSREYEQADGDIKKTGHPRRSLFLKEFSCNKGIPVGAVLHVLAACKKLRKVNLHFKSIVEDFAIISAAFPTTAASSMIFVSDVPRTWTQPSTEVHSITANAIIQYLTNLSLLQRLDIRNAKWLSTANVESILFGCPALTQINFRGSGNTSDDPNYVVGAKRYTVCWAVKASKKALAEVLSSI